MYNFTLKLLLAAPKKSVEEDKLDTSTSFLDPLIEEDKDEDLDVGDNVNTIVQNILNTYNDNLLNR